MKPFKIQSYELCHTGMVRDHNEDAVVSLPGQGLWAVADGMGGHARGDYASQAVISSLLDMTLSHEAHVGGQLNSIQRVLEQTSQLLISKAQEISEQTIIGSTVVVMVIDDNNLGIFWAGDSRAYRLREGQLTQLTTDHTVANELIRAQGFNREDARSAQDAEALTTAVGASVFTPERREDKTQPGDRFCLCSDGLNKVVPDWEIESVLNLQQGPEPAAQQLLDLSLDRQATDNVSIIVIDHL
ncbi:serine/threonine-protein phosphatase [Luminiphilus sp.]|nr:serine/threonine-protein phosphatase [Luminiphilus sp.]